MSNSYNNDGVHTGMTGAVVNSCIWATVCMVPIANFIAIFNAFPTIALVFSIIAASTSKSPAKRQMSLNFARRAGTMNICALAINIVSIIVGIGIIGALG